MDVDASLKAIEASLNGFKISEADARTLIKGLPRDLPLKELTNLQQIFPLAGCSFSVAEEDDESGLGVELMWLSPDQILDEALHAYPGKAILPLGYLPIGSCLLGSGDPYFLNLKGSNIEDPALVRVPHDFASEGESYPLDKVEIVASSLSSFFQRAAVGT